MLWIPSEKETLITDGFEKGNVFPISSKGV